MLNLSVAYGTLNSCIGPRVPGDFCWRSAGFKGVPESIFVGIVWTPIRNPSPLLLALTETLQEPMQTHDQRSKAKMRGASLDWDYDAATMNLLEPAGFASFVSIRDFGSEYVHGLQG